jgi:hypothetical protein
MKARIVKKKPADKTLDTFLETNGIKFHVRMTPAAGELEYMLLFNKSICVQENPGESFALTGGHGAGADLAVREFMSNISGKCISLDHKHQEPISVPELTWDGILRAPVKKKRKAKGK